MKNLKLSQNTEHFHIFVLVQKQPLKVSKCFTNKCLLGPSEYEWKYTLPQDNDN